MTNAIILQLIKTLAGLLVGSDIFRAAVGAVQRWETRKLAGLEKKEGVLVELETIGYQIAGRAANILIELAVQYASRLK